MVTMYTYTPIKLTTEVHSKGMVCIGFLCLIQAEIWATLGSIVVSIVELTHYISQI